ncbi:FAD binding domain-containing protein [Aspergillus leporis]|uniref:FAD binding domain-containing protein n=1 Tax=Aspergillus leporis TaxID=41062 RepID=A0A5N5WM03_9EURO|nr:FAD binding domain-containing protein [Aspergillus leporis]
MGSLEERVPVVIVGAGLAGLTMATALGTYQIPAVLIERRETTLHHPRADGFTPRTVEILRALGFSEDLVPEHAPGFQLRRARVESLTGKWFEELAWTQTENKEAVEPTSTETKYPSSPYAGARTPQDVLEPILLQRVEELGIKVKRHHEFVSLEQDHDGVTVMIKGPTGATSTLRTEYLIAADGHRSRVRECLGIGRKGHGVVNSVKSVLFRAPALAPYLEKGVTQFTIDQLDLKAFLIAYQDGRLVLHLPNNREYDAELLRSLVQQAVGSHEMDLEILGTSQWDLSALIADRFRDGRVYLIGDAAHSLPPNRGGYGANTGIADAHNLAWKLASVVKGVSDPLLLETYEEERVPIAWQRHDQIFARSDFKTLQEQRGGDGVHPHQITLDDEAVEFGQLYCSQGIPEQEAGLPVARRPDEWAGQPGTRAPHVWIQKQGINISTLSLFQGAWVVLSEDHQWGDIVARFFGVEQEDDVFPKFGDMFGIATGGCSLVRPDGYIAWRTKGICEKPVEALTLALKIASSLKGK